MKAQEKGAACPSERYAGKDRVGKAAGAGVQLPEQEYSCQSRKGVLTEWRERWHREQGRKASWPESIAALDQPSQSCLKLYSQLKKVESSALFQARTGRIGLRRFLASVKVPEVESEECLCEKGKETAEHVLLHCDNTPQRAWSRGA